MASGGRIESWTLSDAGIRASLAAQGPAALGQAFAAASRDSSRDPGDSPHPAPPVPPQQPTEIVDTAPAVRQTVLIPVLTSKAPQQAAPCPSLPEPPPLPAKPTPPQPSKWWTLLLIIPADRDRAGGRPSHSFNQRENLVHELQKTVDELGGHAWQAISI